MPSTAAPNVDFGSIAIFFDTHPQEQDSYVSSYWTALKQQLHTAMTGIVPPYLPYGTLRLQWWTVDGNVGIKDYHLHEFVLVKQNFDLLVSMGAASGKGKVVDATDEEGEGEVRRVVVKGWSGQNPYTQTEEGRRIARGVMMGGDVKGGLGRELGGWGEVERRKERQRKQKEVFDNEEEGRTGKILDIEGVIDAHDRAEEERRKKEEERIWKENEGALNGGMV